MSVQGSDVTIKHPAPTLRRAISLPLLVLYGLGVTIGAGIYVLIGVAVEQAGMFAPSAFLLAAVVMAFSACSFAELSGRLPQAAGEAVYVEAAFGLRWLTLATGFCIVLSAIVAAAAITLGGTGYILTLIALPQPVVVAAVIVLMGTVAAWGVLESVTFAGIFTVLEILGLLVIVAAGVRAQPEILLRLPEVVPAPGDGAALAAVFGASLIAFFAFIGFDDVVNLVEETRDPARVMPLGIGLTLVLATLLYVMVATVAVMSVPHAELAGTGAPIALLFQRLTGLSPVAISLIAIVATLNGIVIQIIMAARVLYGLGAAGRLPRRFAAVNPRTRTPLFSTALVSAAVLCLALFLPIGRLAEVTTQVILVVFALVNLSLFVLKRRRVPAPAGVFTVPAWVPAVGVVTCLGLLLGPLLI
ncbi:amino acid permease [Rhodobacteraceae bacterium 2CG4]|uniref:Amino acid permease n=1 Tax=Halovulum marinum TaxID=2662447 RepID=A0A6L5Z675_9RHOB|nr:amino acid permease [Halovulum marinum]MSU91482.1 amino acid permease [Halovulum marinum]